MRPGVVVGIHAHAEPARLVETVRSLSAGGEGDGVRIVLLPDGPDAALSAALITEPMLTNLPQWGPPGRWAPLPVSTGWLRVVTPRWWSSSRAARCSDRDACLCW